MGKILCYLLIFVGLLSSNIVLASVVINEIQYNPTLCQDSYCEWIEIYNPTNESVNVTNWTLCDNNILPGFINYSDGIVYNDGSSLLPAFSFGIITDGGSGTQAYTYFQIHPNSYSFHVDSGTLCGGLSDTADEIILKNQSGDLIDRVSYFDDQGADGNNYSLEKRSDGTFGESIVLFGTPGSNNSIVDLSAEYSVLKITEVLPDPFGSDDSIKPLGEWVEIFNSGRSAIDLRGLFITDAQFENELYISESSTLSDSGTIISPGEYKVIYKSGDADFALNNNGYEEVHLYTQNASQITFMSYSGSTQGMSWSIIDGAWYETKPTSGDQNMYQESCDWKLSLNMPNAIFRGDDFDFQVTLERLFGKVATVTVRGKIENINGEVIKEYSPWTRSKITTQNTKTYTPNLQEGTYQLTFWIDEVSCHDSESQNDEVEQLVAINERYLDDESVLDIENLYLGNDQSASWGDQFRVRVNVYKGAATKYTLELWAQKDGEKISKRTKVNVHDKYRYYDLTLPLFLDANCDSKFSDGRATIVLDGLDSHVEESFIIEGNDLSLCNQSSIPFEKHSLLFDDVDVLSSPDFNEEEEGLSDNILEVNMTKIIDPTIANSLTSTENFDTRKGIVVYQSSSAKAIKLVPYLMIFSIMILIFLFFKKKI